MTALRVLICLGALALGGYALERHSDAGACSRALTDSYHFAAKRPAPAPQQIAATLEDKCRGTSELSSAAAALATRAPATSRALADRAVHDEPDDARAWLAVAFANRATDLPRARQAQARALQLNRYSARVVAGS